MVHITQCKIESQKNSTFGCLKHITQPYGQRVEASKRFSDKDKSLAKLVLYSTSIIIKQVLKA